MESEWQASWHKSWDWPKSENAELEPSQPENTETEPKSEAAKMEPKPENTKNEPGWQDTWEDLV